MMIMLGRILINALRIYEILILVRCILSWFPNSYNQFTEILYKITDPVLEPVRRLLEKIMGGRTIGIDLSPIIVFFIIEYILSPLIRMLFFGMLGGLI